MQWLYKGSTAYISHFRGNSKLYTSFCHSYTGVIFLLPLLNHCPPEVAQQGTRYEHLVSQVDHVERHGRLKKCEIL